MKVKISLAMPSLAETVLTSKMETLRCKLANWGYAAIEPLVDNLVNIDASKTEEILRRDGLELSGLRTGLVYTKSDLSFSNPDRQVRARAVQRIKSQVLFSLKFENRPCLLIGMVQGRLQHKVSVRQAKRWILESLSECASFAAAHNVKLCLEQMNRSRLEYHNTINEVVQTINEINSPGLGLLIDTFHMNLEEKSLYRSIQENQKYISHVHFADENREVPGEGHLDFPEVIRALKDIEYNGYITIEIQPRSDFDIAALKAVKYVRSIL